MVEVEVGDDDRVHSRPRLEPTQPRQHARPAIEQDAPAVFFDEIPRLRAARVGPSGRAADDVDPHAPYPRCKWPLLARRSAAVYNWPVATGPVDTLKKVPLFAGLDDKLKKEREVELDARLTVSDREVL